MAEKNSSIQLIDGDGIFNVHGVEAFIKANLAGCGLSYAVVSIMGPQSSGKSTLMNHLFHTKFREMVALEGRSRTTQGIWLARSVGNPCTIVMDLEGSDGSERGEDGTAFEKQSALFALAVSDILLINLWNHDIGRQHAANKPLLKTVFQVMTHLISPRKRTLLFVIRDISKTPLTKLEPKLREDIQKIWVSVPKAGAYKEAPFSEFFNVDVVGLPNYEEKEVQFKMQTPLTKLEPKLREDIQKIWVSVPKAGAYKETPLGKFFNVEVVALPSYEEKEEQFKEQVASLKQKLDHFIAPGGLAGDRRARVPAAEFFLSAQQIWKDIKENKDLDLPAHTVMVATIRCEEIAHEKFAGFSSDEEWHHLEEAVQHGLVPHFGQKLSLLLDKCLSGYDMEAQYFNDGVRTEKRMQLESKLLQLAYPACKSMLSHLRSKTLDDFKKAFDMALQRGEGFAVAVRHCTQSLMSVFDAHCKEAVVKQAKWDCLKIRETIRREIDAHVDSVRADKLSELKAKYEGQLNKALVKHVEVLLDTACDDPWLELRKLFKHETKSALSGLASALCAFDIDRTTTNEFLDDLDRYARNVVESKVKEEVARVPIRMKDRFLTLFTRDTNGMPRTWTENENITDITTTARYAALKFLSVMAAIRMDDNIDNIYNTLSRALLSVSDNGIQLDFMLASSSWEKVPPARTLITPAECDSLWRRFKTETDDFVTQAKATQEAVKALNNRNRLLNAQYEEAVNALNNRNRQLNAQYEELNNRNRQLEAQYKEAVNALNNRNRQLDVQHEEAVNALNNRNRQLEAQYEEVVNELNNRNRRNNAQHEKVVNALNNRLRQLNAQYEEVVNELNNRNRRNDFRYEEAANRRNHIVRGLTLAVKLGSLTAHVLSGGIIPNVNIGYPG